MLDRHSGGVPGSWTALWRFEGAECRLGRQQIDEVRQSQTKTYDK